MDTFGASLNHPSQPLEPSSGFLRPGSNWPTIPAQTVEEVQHRIRRSCSELVRLERSIAFIGDSGNKDFDDTDELKKVLNIILPVVNSQNFREIDEAVKAMFEVLSPWSACAIKDLGEDTRWMYRIHQSNLRLIRTLSPQLIASLPADQVDILDIYSQAAKDALETGDMMAKIWANEAAEASQQAAKPVEGKLKGRMAALKRQLSRSNKP